MIDPELDKKSSAVGELSALSDMAKLLKARQDQAKKLENELKELNSEIHRMESSDIPEMMQELGVNSFELDDGCKVTIRNIIKASLPSATSIARERDPAKRALMINRFREGVAYLERNGAGAIVKNQLTADLGKDSGDIARKAQEMLRTIGIPSRADQTVNPNSLSSWCKERIEGGNEIDHDLFGIFSGQKAHIKS